MATSDVTGSPVTWTLYPTSCGDGCNWAWCRKRPSGGEEVVGCAGHTAVPEGTVLRGDPGPSSRCRRCAGDYDLMDVAMAPGMTYCRWCREHQALLAAASAVVDTGAREPTSVELLGRLLDRLRGAAGATL